MRAKAQCNRKCLGDGFLEDPSGAVLIETIIIIPVILLFMMGILEFGAFLHNKLQVETGLRDAARYLARCGHSDSDCETWAEGVAVCGIPGSASSVCSSGAARVSGWNSKANPIVVTRTTSGTVDIIKVSVTGLSYPGSALLSSIIPGLSITISARHEERDIGQ